MPKTPEEIAAEAKAAADKVAADAKAAADKAAADQAVATKAAHLAEHGFPLETAVADMAPLEQAAYWRFEAKKQQKKNEGVDVEKLRADAAELATLKAASATDADKAIEQARREGENLGAEKYLKDAVMGRFMALTGKKDDEAEVIFAHVDPKSFTDDKGAIDPEKLKAYAATYGASAAGTSQDAVAAALARTRQAGGGSGSSISEKRKEVRESMTPKA
jgi:hypothetical protein